MAKKLPARPNLEHLRGQAKTRLTALKKQNKEARLADAQLDVARESGFRNWPALMRHVETLRALEGEWRFTGLDIEGTPMPSSALSHSRILIDGDRFRSESPEATYDGVFTIDAGASPARIDIAFVEGPEAGNTSYGLFALDGDSLTFCLGLVGASRPSSFAPRRGSGHALSRLRRVSASRPDGVSGGTPQPPAPQGERADPASFDVPMTPLLRRLEGEWAAVELVMNGKPMPPEWLSWGSRTATGNEVEVVFGGQTMVHARVRIDERATPLAVDYLSLKGKTGTVTFGIMEWIGDEVRFLMAGPGEPRPGGFGEAGTRGTLSRWRRKP